MHLETTVAMKRVLLILLLCVLGLAASGQTPQERYIQTYAPMAVSEMYRTGVPASITLAQGLLESRYGLSSLAKDGNNHFGIKCHDWKGRKMYVDDDKKGECFRVYDDAEQSFMDHSDFLRYRDRYKFLFENETTDYKSWAYGLKKAGYATDPSYPQKLIKYIEDYKLYEYDSMSVRQAEDKADKEEARLEKEREKEEKARLEKESKEKAKEDKQKAREEKKARREAEARRRKASRKKYVDASRTEIVASPNSIEEPKRVEARIGVHERYRYNTSLEMMSRNGVPYIPVVPGETVASIAKRYDLFEREVRSFNDLGKDEEVKPGDIIYLQRKKKHTQRGLDKYIVEKDGENLRDIAQRFAVRLSTLQKLNSFEPGHVLREGDTVLMRKS